MSIERNIIVKSFFGVENVFLPLNGEFSMELPLKRARVPDMRKVNLSVIDRIRNILYFSSDCAAY